MLHSDSFLLFLLSHLFHFVFNNHFDLIFDMLNNQHCHGSRQISDISFSSTNSSLLKTSLTKSIHGLEQLDFKVTRRIFKDSNPWPTAPCLNITLVPSVSTSCRMSTPEKFHAVAMLRAEVVVPAGTHPFVRLPLFL